MILGWILVGIAVLLVLLLILIPLRNEIPPPERAYKCSEVIWGLWHTGTNMMDLGLVDKYHSKIRRLLVLDPFSAIFKEATERGRGTAIDSSRQIKKLTKLARGKGIEVKWYDSPRNYTLTIFDPIEGNRPDSNKAYCITKELAPNKIEEDRPIAMIPKRRWQFGFHMEDYEDIWDNHSRVPSSEDYE